MEAKQEAQDDRRDDIGNPIEEGPTQWTQEYLDPIRGDCDGKGRPNTQRGQEGCAE
jgi:hypothetical protein